jgi:hypothetical protein
VISKPSTSTRQNGPQVREGQVSRDQAANERWIAAYSDELSIDRHGFASAVCSRAEAHTVRLQLLYALLDRSAVIGLEHVEAALSLWRYCEASAVLVFGERIGDPIADAIVDALEQTGEQGLTRDEIRDLFSRHRSRADLDRALGMLLRAGRIIEETEPTGGRPARRHRLNS